MRLPPDESRRRFATARVARLATVNGAGQPHLVPVVFAVDADTVHWAVDGKPKTAHHLRRLRNISENPNVCLLADHYADDWTHLWWARADGAATVLTAPAERTRALTLLAHKYPQYQHHLPEGPVVAVEVTRWSGWAA
ncbi:TIGR03668 family PPOX class F420-dependent oxidoreductase [Streptomyces capparidis]